MKIAELCITNQCNFSCDYCISDAAFIRKRPEKSWDFSGPCVEFAPWYEFVKRHLSGYIIQITGGEPLLVGDIHNFINDIVDLGNIVVVNTNGSIIQERLPYINPNVIFRISYHPEQRSNDKFVEHLSGLDKTKTIINYVIHPRHIENGTVEKNLEFLDSLGFIYEANGFEGNYNGKPYKFYLDYYNKYSSGLEKAEQLEMVVVQPHGAIFPCHGMQAMGKASIGNIHTGRFDPSGVCKNSCSTPDGLLSVCPVQNPIARILKYLRV